MVAELRHKIAPSDILIRNAHAHSKHDVELLFGSEAQQGIDIVYVAEGYTAEQRELFFNDARVAMEALFKHEPFGRLRDRFNIRAVFMPSEREDVSNPGKGNWHETPCGSHFYTLYSDRYLMTEKMFQLYDLLEGIPTEHIIVLANTMTYGGGGIFNLYAMTSTRQAWFRPVVVHEFGHSFAGLGDEYFYDDEFEVSYPVDVEPWCPNLSTLVDFNKKMGAFAQQSRSIGRRRGTFRGRRLSKQRRLSTERKLSYANE